MEGDGTTNCRQRSFDKVTCTFRALSNFRLWICKHGNVPSGSIKVVGLLDYELILAVTKLIHF
jgi:hypothetical protein